MIVSYNPTLHRSGDPDTSVNAANQQTEDKRTELQRVIEAWALGRETGFTDWELCAEPMFEGMPHSTLRTRRAELAAQGWLVDSGWRRFPPHNPSSKRLGIVWVHRIYFNRSNDNG